MIDLETLDRWEKLASLAQRGPWEADTEELGDAVVWGQPGDDGEDNLIANVGRVYSRVVSDRAEASEREQVVFDMQIADARFVAECRSAMPQLIAELRELYQQLHDARAGVLEKSDEAFEVIEELRHTLRTLPDTPALLLKHRLKGKGGVNG